MGSALTLLQQVQGWLEATKSAPSLASGLDPALEEAAKNLVFARVGRVYDITLWVDQASTPALVTAAESMLIAAWIYYRQYSEVTAEDENKYAVRLEEMAENLVSGIESGIINLIDSDQKTVFEQPNNPDYIPSTLTSSGEVYDALGRTVGHMGSEDIKFRMGSRF